MPLPRFTNEAAFRSEWIAPFLSKLGYILPKHIHGANEQGKDFYFAEHDKFGHLRFLAAQVKNGDIGAGSTELDQLLNQVRRCFTVTLKHHKGAENQRISAVYIMASGRISSTAREYISDAMRQEHYGENVYYLDGETLYNLERHAIYLEDKTLRQRLLALLSETTYNVTPLGHLLMSVPSKKLVFMPCRTVALEDALRNPFPDDVVPYAIVEKLWRFYQELNKNCVPYNIGWNEEAIKSYTAIATHALKHTDSLGKACKEAIANLDYRITLDLEIE